MSRVDPFMLPIPKQFLGDLETRQFMEYMSRFLHDLWVYSGSGSTGGSSLTYVSATSNITTTGNEFIKASAAITIALNASPSNLETVIVARNTTAGPVIINGNGNNISGSSTYTMLADNEVRELTYLDGEWF